MTATGTTNKIGGGLLARACVRGIHGPVHCLRFEGEYHMTLTHDLTTYEGWLNKARELLDGRPDWTAIKQDDTTFVVVLKGGVYWTPQEPDGHVYSEDDLADFDHSAWNGDAWDGCTAEQSALTLTVPEIVTLHHR